MTTEPTTDKIKVAIVGGGLGGLCLAIGLLQHAHIDVQIYEGANEFSEIGAGVSIGPNARRSLKLLSPDVWDAYTRQASGNGPQYPALQNVLARFRWGRGPKAGQVITDLWSEGGQQSVHRARFLDELVKLVPAEIAHFRKRLTRLQDDADGAVTLFFDDDSTVTADCIVGADGVHSVVRKQLLSPDHPAYHPTFSGCVAYRGLIPAEKAGAVLGDEAVHVATMYAAPGGFIMTYPVDFYNLLNVVAVDVEVDSWDGASVQPADRTKMKAKWADWSPAARSIVDMLDIPETKTWSLWELSPLSTFCRSRVLIVGDAAHASVPFQGAGAGQAMEDALVLSNLLGAVGGVADLVPAFQAFDQVRRPRSQKVVATSREAGELFAMRLPGVMDDEKLIKQNLDERYDWLHNRDMQVQVEQALTIFEEIKKFGFREKTMR